MIANSSPVCELVFRPSRWRCVATRRRRHRDKMVFVVWAPGDCAASASGRSQWERRNPSKHGTVRAAHQKPRHDNGGRAHQTRNVITARPIDTVKTLAALFTKHGISAMLVCNEADVLLGFIGEGDLMRPFVRANKLCRATQECNPRDGDIGRRPLYGTRRRLLSEPGERQMGGPTRAYRCDAVRNCVRSGG